MQGAISEASLVNDQVGDLAGSHPVEPSYVAAQRQVHWAVAVLVLLQLLVGTSLGVMQRKPENDILRHTLLDAHLVTGTVIFALMVYRLQLRRKFGAPPPPAGTPLDASLFAKANHYGFYALLLAQPVVGWLAYGSKAFMPLHEGIAIILVLAICAHLAGVIYHTSVRHDGLLGRMTIRGGENGVRRPV